MSGTGSYPPIHFGAPAIGNWVVGFRAWVLQTLYTSPFVFESKFSVLIKSVHQSDYQYQYQYQFISSRLSDQYQYPHQSASLSDQYQYQYQPVRLFYQAPADLELYLVYSWETLNLPRIKPLT